MLRYILKRLGQTVLVLIAVSILSFFLIRLAPGNPARMVLPDSASDEVVAAMEVKMGLDKPLYVQYWKYISGVFQGDLGTSSSYKTDVGKIIAQRLPNTLKLAGTAILISLLLGIPLAILAGTRQGTAVDFGAVLFALIGQAMSPVWLTVLNVYVFSVQLGWLPAVGSGGLKYIILPAVTLAYPVAAEITRLGRSGMIDVLREDYITAAYAKGMSKRQVFMKYAFKNALIPIVTIVGLELGIFLCGTVIVETVFGWTGVGQLMFQSVGNRDYQLVQSLLLVLAAMFAIINLLVDIVNSLIDPRIRLE